MLTEEGSGEVVEASGTERIEYVCYKDETQLPAIMALIDQELSEPYSIFTYRYFITLWPHLCFMLPGLAGVKSGPDPIFAEDGGWVFVDEDMWKNIYSLALIAGTGQFCCIWSH